MAPTVETFLRSFSSRLEAPVREHLKNVYASLTLSVIAAGVGAYIHMFTTILSAGLLSFLGTIGFMIALFATSDEDGKNRSMRFGFLLGFAFFTGHSMGPLLDAVVDIDPSIIMTALIATSLIFMSFTLSALFASRGSFLYVGGLAMSGLSTLLLLSIMNMFFGSYLIHQSILYLGLAVMFGFVLYDTQLIIEKRRSGDKDFVAHSLDLFIDFVGIFRRLLVILSQKEQQKRNRRD